MKANPTGLKRARERAGLTQAQTVNRIKGIGQAHYSHVELGQKGTTFAILCKIAARLNVDVETIVAEDMAEQKAAS